MDQQTRWPDLLPDLIRQISGRLNHAVDFVHFHAVCRPWRDSHDATATATTRPFLPWLLTTATTQHSPWLLAPNIMNYDELRMTCVFSKSSKSYCALRVPAYPNWVANDDGTAVRYLGDHPYSSLHDPLTGATARLVPTVPDGKDSWEYRRPRGVLFHDGTILLYNKYTIEEEDGQGGNATRFTAVLRRPGDAAWAVIERTLEAFEYGKFCVAYHGGKILVSVQASQWHVVTLNNDAAHDMLIPSPWTPTEHGKYFYRSGHVMESRGELLWASLHILNNSRNWRRDVSNLVQAVSLSVYSFQEEVSAPKKMRWVRKDRHSLADRVMFLGWPNSFAVDASRLGGDGGYAYFVCSGGEVSLNEWSAVFRYNLIENKAEFVEWLPRGWPDDKCAWLMPQPTISTIQKSMQEDASRPKMNSTNGCTRNQ